MARSLLARLNDLEHRSAESHGRPFFLWDDGSPENRRRRDEALRQNSERQVLVFRWLSDGERAGNGEHS